jgi:pimeloyl-ACP methyl ester carboxylesterase
MVWIPDAGHFTLNEEPGLIAEVVLDALSSGTPV